MLTILGTHPKPARYVLDGREHECDLAPVALLELLMEPKRPNRVLALCTPEAKEETWPKLKGVLPDQCRAELVEVPTGNEQSDIGKFLEVVARAIPKGVDLTVDVTHGLRHFAFLTYAAVLYMAALQGIRVQGAYYGLLKPDAPSPFLDLASLLELPRWVHALDVLRETGSALPMAQLLGVQSPISRDLKSLSEAYLSGLPLELGLQARKVKDHGRSLRRLLRKKRLPLEGELCRQLTDMLEPQALLDGPQGDGWKRGVSLSEAELERQARIIDSLLEHGHTATALRLMKEWTVSWVIHRQNPGAEWLDYHKARRPTENRLRAIADQQQTKLAEFWRELTELRNGFAHHGMRGQSLVNDRKTRVQIDRVREYWESTLRSLPNCSLSLGESPGGRVLISPMGKSPGVLFSAVKACQTEGISEEITKCLVICSRETEGYIEDALRRAGYDARVETLRLEDAFGGGRDEIEHLVQAAQKHLIGATEVVVNVTGGTTFMGLVVEAIGLAAARRFACPTRRFGLIDRRSQAEQIADPYQAGEAFWLDKAEGADGND